jgi:hypothetical protein
MGRTLRLAGRIRDRSVKQKVVRLRGDAPEIVWTPAMDRRIDVCHDLREFRPAQPPAEPPEWWPSSEPEERWMLILQEAEERHEEWCAALLHARREAIETFAAAQGWLRADRDYPPQRLVLPKNRTLYRGPGTHWHFNDRLFEHPNWLRSARRMEGVVVHLYPKLDVSALPEEIIVDQLPRSWYYPRLTNAYLFRPLPNAEARSSESTVPSSHRST